MAVCGVGGGGDYHASSRMMVVMMMVVTMVVVMNRVVLCDRAMRLGIPSYMVMLFGDEVGHL